MKRKFLSILAISALMATSCCNQDNCEAPKDEKAKTVKKEQVVTSKNNEVKKEEKSGYLLKEGSVLDIKADAKIDAKLLGDKFSLKHFSEKRSEEGEEYTIPMASVSDKKGELLVVDLEKDIATNIKIKSPRIKTEKGIGVNSTVGDFLKKYKDAEILYSYVGGFFWLETKELKRIQFILDDKGYIGDKGKLGNGDLDILKSKDMNPETKITWIRMF